MAELHVHNQNFPDFNYTEHTYSLYIRRLLIHKRFCVIRAKESRNFAARARSKQCLKRAATSFFLSSVWIWLVSFREARVEFLFRPSKLWRKTDPCFPMLTEENSANPTQCVNGNQKTANINTPLCFPMHRDNS